MINNETGQILPIIVVTLGVVLFSVLFVVAGAQIYYTNASYSQNAESASALAEAGIDKAITALNNTGGGYNGEKDISFGEGTYSVTITDVDPTTKLIESVGYVPSRIRADAKRTIDVKVSRGIGLSFPYGLQTGEGGICMGNGAILNGSVYSNASISLGNTTNVTGDVFVAGGTQPAADQQTDCSGVNCQDYIFGKSVSGESRQDVAESFKPSQTKAINKVALKLKKTGTPANPTVRIMKDSGGKPDKNNVLATGTLSANLVTTQYSFVDVTFDSTPTLTSGTTYWIMVHSSSLDSSNYWSWLNDLAQSYTNGSPAWSSNWQAHTPVWTAVAGDLGFKTYMGGTVNFISLGNGSTINGNAHANTINGGNGVTIKKDAYYQTIDSLITVQGTKHPNSADPAPTVFPVSDANVNDWESQALAAGLTNGDVSGGTNCTKTLGPGKISGNLTLGNGCKVTVKAPLWITGNISGGSPTTFTLDSSFGATSGPIIVNGTTTLGNGSDIRGSGTPGSYLMLFSGYDSTAGGTASSCTSGGGATVAIDVGNSSISGIVYAPLGRVNLSNGASFKEITAWEITLGNNSILNYDTGFASTVFSSGPSGAYSLIKGTYLIK